MAQSGYDYVLEAVTTAGQSGPTAARQKLTYNEFTSFVKTCLDHYDRFRENQPAPRAHTIDDVDRLRVIITEFTEASDAMGNGMIPPDKAHRYRLAIDALKSEAQKKGT